MNDTIPSPGKGQPMTAAWASAVTGVCNAFRVAGFGGTLARDGAGACGNAPLPANRRDRRSAAPVPDYGVYQITETTRTVEQTSSSAQSETETAEVCHKFTMPYVMVGGILCEKPVETVLEDLLPNAGDDGKLFLALRIPASPATDETSAEVLGFGTIAELAAAQADTSYHHIPLYLLNVVEQTSSSAQSDDEEESEPTYTYTVVCDFRLMVHAQQWEVFS